MIQPDYIEEYFYSNVNPDGTFDNEPGAVNIEATITLSSPHGGCGMKGCNCSPGHWIMISKGRNSKGEVKGKTLYFKNRKDLLTYAKENNLKP